MSSDSIGVAISETPTTYQQRRPAHSSSGIESPPLRSNSRNRFSFENLNQAGQSQSGLSALAAFFNRNSWRNMSYSGAGCQTDASTKFFTYIRRLFHYQHMDFEYAAWQMAYLIIAPQKVYRNFSYRKQTKNQWARDDPAFLVLLSVFLCISSIGFAVALGLSFVGFLEFILWVVFVDAIGIGCVIATLLRFVANQWFRPAESRHLVVEWGYAFDIHLNALFPLLLVLHFLQLFFLSFIRTEYIASAVVSNLLWFVAVSYYVYITFLGYNAIPFLRNTRLLLVPLSGMVIFVCIATPLNVNLTRLMCDFYQYRI